MARFSYVTTKRGPTFWTGIGPTVLLFAMVVGLFVVGTGSLSKGSTKRQRDSLNDALSRDIIYCYATTGHYPESLDAIRTDYGLYYDEALFYVDYKVRAQNIIPEVTIIDLVTEDNRTPIQKAQHAAAELSESWTTQKNKMKQNILSHTRGTL